MAQQEASTLYPTIESSVAQLDESEHSHELLRIEKEIASYLKDVVDPLDGMSDFSILPSELMSNKKNPSKPKLDPIKRMSNNEEIDEEEEVDEEEEDDDEENEEEEEDEEEDAAGDYIVSHFDNGEGPDDNDDEGDDMNIVL